MNVAQAHLILVHLPAVGLPFVLVLMLVALGRKDESLFRLACWFLLACVLAGILAYLTGPPTMELLEADYGIAGHYVEQHGAVARGAFFGMIILGVMAFLVPVRHWQKEPPSKPLRWAVVIVTSVICYLLAWTSHLGGLIRHPEAREPAWPLFPELPRAKNDS